MGESCREEMNACSGRMPLHPRLADACAELGSSHQHAPCDPTASVPSVLAEVKNGTVEAFYVREPGGELLARVAGETRQYYFFDGLGSTQAICPASEGNPTDRYFYTPWGEADSRAQSLSGTPGNPYRYVGQLGYYTHHQDANLSDWMQLGVRFYQPGIGRFERRDPVVAVGQSAFGYCNSGPLMRTDASGMFFLTLPVAGITLVTIGSLYYSWLVWDGYLDQFANACSRLRVGEATVLPHLPGWGGPPEGRSGLCYVIERDLRGDSATRCWGYDVRCSIRDWLVPCVSVPQL